jgi:hypothetical protein
MVGVAMAVLLAFAFGLAGARTSLCCVAAVIGAVRERNPDGLLVLATTVVMCAGLVLVAATFDPLAPHLPAAAGVSFPVVAGAVLLAIGSLVNGACYLGTALYIGRGRLDFLCTLAGIALASHLRWLPWGTGSAGTLRRVGALSGGAVPYLAGAAVLCIVLVGYALRSPSTARRTALRGALAIGVAAGLLEGIWPGWTSAAVFGTADFATLASALAFFAGGLAGARLAHTFAMRGFSRRGAVRHLAGGWLMGTGAAWVPGGNDTLLTWATPGVAAYGAAALLLYLSTLALAVLIAPRTSAMR